MEEKRHRLPPTTFIGLFQHSGPKQPIRLHTSPGKKRSSGAPALWPSPHGRLLPLAIPWLQLNVAFHAPLPVEPHRHKDAEEEQDYAAGDSDYEHQQAELRERRWQTWYKKKKRVGKVGKSSSGEHNRGK